jgi:hypothetical protein
METDINTSGILPIDLNLLAEVDRVISGSWTRTKCPFKYAPTDYVRFARQDLVDGSDRGFLNAYHNAKRALDSQMDFILWNLGLTKPDINAPQKLAVLSRIGASSVSILQRLIRQRNLLEHEYESIDPASATDAVDVADLFVQTTSLFSNLRHHQFEFWSSSSKVGGQIQFCYEDLKEGLDKIVPWLCVGPRESNENSPSGIQYSIYRSMRTDNRDPSRVYDEWENSTDEYEKEGKIFRWSLPPSTRLQKYREFGIEYIEKGVVLPKYDEHYCALARIMVIGMRDWM